jgi:ubiquinone/menaquinone biosynthesis C-methylase UbiE
MQRAARPRSHGAAAWYVPAEVGDRDQRHDGEAARLRAEAGRYWNAHPIGVDSVEFPPGSRESFDALYARWRETIDEHRERFLAACRGQRVLEVGCGTACDGRYLVENGVDYRAVDASRRSLALAREHFSQQGLPARFANADATALPFADGAFDLVFSIGVVHHVPDWERACREIARVTAPAGAVRVMVYNRHSYHYALVRWVVRPLIRLMLRVPPLARLARLGPRKLRELLEIAREHGASLELLLAASTDTSSAGAGNYNPLSYFLTESELRRVFADLEQARCFRKEVKYFPLPFLRGWVERRFGFFLTLSGRKPARERAAQTPSASGSASTSITT